MSKFIASLFLVSFICALQFFACSESSTSGGALTPCETDEDCRSHERCLDNLCYDHCRTSADCADGRKCIDGACIGEPDEDGDFELEIEISENEVEIGVEEEGLESEEGAEGEEQEAPPECDEEHLCTFGKICVDGRCVFGCVKDTDCPASTICNPDGGDHGVCVECITAEDCPNDSIYKCDDAHCKAVCRSDEECAAEFPDRPYCTPWTGKCEPCFSDEHCPANEPTLCHNHRCLEGCRDDTGCAPFGTHCHYDGGEFGRCVQCTADEHCEADEQCREQACTFSCERHQCPPERPVCSEEMEACFECTENGHCQPNERCMENQCTSACETSADCRQGAHCLTEGVESGRCVDCLTSADCEEGYCVNHVCLDVACQTDAHCAEGEFCHPQQSVCHPLPERSCASDADCAPRGGFTQTCNPLTRECGFACTLATDCPMALPICDESGYCVGCQTQADCPNTRCDEASRMCRHCESNADCAAGRQVCIEASGACVDCETDSDCGFNETCFMHHCKEIECYTDEHCDGESYCHPSMLQCLPLPETACSEAAPCENETMVCDPLTKRCIESCADDGFCLNETYSICSDDGGCYGCMTNADCAGQICNQETNRCVGCERHEDCYPIARFCDTLAGVCVDCADDADCAFGLLCAPGIHQCVVCYDDAHCTEEAKPNCSFSNQCIAACEDECQSTDDSVCTSLDTLKRCGQFNDDRCLEWSEEEACARSERCEGGACICQSDCELGELACKVELGLHYIGFCMEDEQNGCRYFRYMQCLPSQICTDGSCVPED